MKKYKLLQWYPSLYEDIEEKTIVEYKDGWIYYVNKRGNKTTVEFDEREFKFADFWELIEEKKEPLFITDDGVELFSKKTTVYCITRGYNKHDENYISMRKIESYLKVFFHESNADEYILWNKPLLTLHDIDKELELYTSDFDKLIKLAKERI